MFALPPLRCTIDVFGIDRVLFSVDYPYSENASGRALLDRLGQLPLKLADQEKITGGNAAAAGTVDAHTFTATLRSPLQSSPREPPGH
jgi:predicted TIM-barrel fold metal-dependent hydrolase